MPDGSTSVRYLYEGISDEQIIDNKANVIDKRLEEMLFSRMVMIVEGESDRRLLRSLLSGDHVEELVKHRDIPVGLVKLMGMLRDITIVSAGGNDSFSQLIEPLETLSIPYFMVADGDYIIDTRNLTSSTKLSPCIMKKQPVRNMFETCDLLKDTQAFDKLKQLSNDRQSRSVAHESIRPSGGIGQLCDIHKNHKEGKCHAVVGNEIRSGCRSVARKRLQAIVKSAFWVLLSDVDGNVHSMDASCPGVFVAYAKYFEEWFRLFTWCHLGDFDLESVVSPYVKEMNNLAHCSLHLKMVGFRRRS